MTHFELDRLDATDQALLVRTGQVSPLELVDASIDAIERINPAINAVIHERFEQARAEAAGDPPDGPFRGVPIVLKDMGCPSSGDPYHLGSRFLKRLKWRADHDSFLTTKFRAAGFVNVGRTNVPELAMSMTTEPLAYGPTRNPWNLGHSTGGSSGGSAAAVAAGLVAVGHANDGGGSLRIPASECGLVGLKPTRGRVTQGPDLGDSWGGALIDGVLTRSVRDTASVLDCISGYVSGDPYSAPTPARPFADEVNAPCQPLRVGLLKDGLSGDPTWCDPECRSAVTNTGLLLESLGHVVAEDFPPALSDTGFDVHFGNLVIAACARELNRLSEMTGQPVPPDEVEPATLGYARAGQLLPAADYLKSVEWLQRFQRRVASWWHDGFDILVSPVIAGPPPPIGWLSDREAGVPRAMRLLQHARQFNATGQPALSLPLHWTPGGLPVGVQIVAAYGREDILIRLASQIEAAAPWADRFPSGMVA